MTNSIDFAYDDAFIAHAYDDAASVETLIMGMKPEFKALCFPSIEVRPDDVVSTPIIDAIRDAAALISIDTPRSRASFWVAFEREFALGLDKPVFAYDPAVNSLRQIKITPSVPIIMPLVLDRDEEIAESILGWAADERGFGVEVVSATSMSDLDIELTEFDGLFVVFCSREYVSDISIKLIEWKAGGRGFFFPRLLLAALDSDPNSWIPAAWRPHVFDPKISLVDLTEGGVVRPFAMRRVDDLIVRAHWLLYELRTSVGWALYRDDY